MLLANGTVAKHIYQVYPDVAFLRHHAPPAPYSVKMLAEKLSLFGIHLDIKSAGGIHSSLMKYETFESNDIFAWARRAVMNNLCAKGMKVTVVNMWCVYCVRIKSIVTFFMMAGEKPLRGPGDVYKRQAKESGRTQ